MQFIRISNLETPSLTFLYAAQYVLCMHTVCSLYVCSMYYLCIQYAAIERIIRSQFVKVHTGANWGTQSWGLQKRAYSGKISKNLGDFGRTFPVFSKSLVQVYSGHLESFYVNTDHSIVILDQITRNHKNNLH